LVAAPTPTLDPADVIAAFSDAYPIVLGPGMVDYNPNWGQATVVTTESIVGNDTLKYAGLNYQGTDFGGPQDLIAAGMTHLHVDFWTVDSTALRVFVIGAGETGIPLTPSFGNWVSVDIPLTDFTAVDLSQVIQFKFEGDGTVFLDNLYFYSGGGGGTTFVNGDFETGDFTGWAQEPGAGTNPTPGTISIDTSDPGTNPDPGNTAVARLQAAGDAALGSQDVLLRQVALDAGSISPGDTIDVSFDLYGSLSGAGGVVFVELIYLNNLGEEASRDFVGAAAPYTPTTTWTTHVGSKPAGANVDGGVTLELKASCGPVTGCGVDAYFDNVTYTVTP